MAVGAQVAARAGARLEVGAGRGTVVDLTSVTASSALALVREGTGAPLMAVLLGANHHLVDVDVEVVAVFPVALDAELCHALAGPTARTDRGRFLYGLFGRNGLRNTAGAATPTRRGGSKG